MISRHEVQVKAVGAIYAINSGLPSVHQNEQSVEKLYSLYKSLIATPSEVIKMISEPEVMNSTEERMYGYLTQFTGSLKPDDLQYFMQFITGSS